VGCKSCGRVADIRLRTRHTTLRGGEATLVCPFVSNQRLRSFLSCVVKSCIFFWLRLRRGCSTFLSPPPNDWTRRFDSPCLFQPEDVQWLADWHVPFYPCDWVTCRMPHASQDIFTACYYQGKQIAKQLPRACLFSVVRHRPLKTRESFLSGGLVSSSGSPRHLGISANSKNITPTSHLALTSESWSCHPCPSCPICRPGGAPVPLELCGISDFPAQIAKDQRNRLF